MPPPESIAKKSTTQGELVMSVNKPRKRFKLVFVLGAIALMAVYGFNRFKVEAFTSNPPLSRTGAPSELTCAASGCHSSNPVNSGGGTLQLTGLPPQYQAGTEYTLTVQLSQTGRSKFGFQLTCLDSAGNLAGTFTITDAAGTTLSSPQTVAGTSRRYISHTTAATTSDQASWSFKWTAPAATTGRVTFYVAGNAANGNFSSSGDLIYTTNTGLDPQAATRAATSTVAASYSTTGLAPDSIAAVFGDPLATSTMAASATPLPTTLAGTTVKVRDSAGTERDAGLFFVSQPQVNYHIPPATVAGTATVTVTSGNGTVSTGNITVANVAPGIFTANASGTGYAAANTVILRNGNLIYDVVATFDTATSQFVGKSINLSQEDVTLVLYGTGIRKRTGLGNVAVMIGGTAAPVAFAGQVDGLIGLDQINAIIPRSLAGRGDVDVVVTVDGRVANTIRLKIQ
jgi:uncharacterized protein (TIGR03437 family)